ncbi:MAG TPA: RnfH family protein [Aromatoleum sp.]|uniref:RnfH family protein n=1 Tax=Aromatoleum sp. TaxID=2307007 RepID=UPI002B492DD0|nr:RnfH family protein [Aromatoleum sp.]HJV28153.1 RnfH family protein [Aromatoleum sp.]
MKIGIAYALPRRQAWLTIDLPGGTTVGDAITRSGIAEQFPEVDLATQKIGIFGKLVRLDTVLEDGDRVEIYRPITCDPKTVRKRGATDGAA